ncbi:S8 family peptidase [Tepidibacillus decaturensis]|uniref:Uncharacterized protein n=1 Tax=Tepidibacillus decaturensis TaxID=1413211 RepID=A0A135L2K5_9BACI|nr:S8 family peptidase [Tepidibacillus decaturensis]KXG43215.1 hypothetical protein U473_03685 [Tepidibacillus decaturensis]
MTRFIRSIIASGILLGIVISLALPPVTPFTFQSRSLHKTNLNEKMAETDYIIEDAWLTSKMQIQSLIPIIKQELKQMDDSTSSYDQVKKNHSNILSIRLMKQTSLSVKENLDPKRDQIFIQSNKDKSLVYIEVPIFKNNRWNTYQLTLRTPIFSEIEKKQQLRMFTVTHLQNNKWKTIPTKYSSRKRLSLGLEENLPDLRPDQEEKGISHYIQNEVVIKFKKQMNEQNIQAFLKKYQLTTKKRRDHTIIAHCPKRSTKTLIRLLEKDPAIEYVEPHFIYLTNQKPTQLKPLIPNDSLYIDYQWNLPTIFTEQGWELTRGKENMIVAVIDTGVDLNHPEFKEKLVKGYNVINPSLPPMDDDGHGTHVAGIIAANTNNYEGIAGITWYNKIMPVKVLDQSGAGTLFDVAEGVIWATDHGAKIINLSLGNYAESKYLHDAIQYAYSKDVVLVAATGNDNIDELGYPAAYPEVIAVSAVDAQQNRAEFSNYGPYVDVVAPGVNIASTYPGNRYAALSGTSMASPHVTGLAALIRSRNPNLTNKEVIDIIKNTTTDLGAKGKDEYYGYGEINILKAITTSSVNVTPIKTHPQSKTKPKSFFQRWLENLANFQLWKK